MLRSRIIPCLLLHKGGVVKSVNFKDLKYVGDPINAVRIFNEKEVDELIVLDIDATVTNQPPDFKLIKRLSAECRMPLCYGGGITNVNQAKQIISSGVEKISLSSAAVYNPDLLKTVGTELGTQSLVVSLDVRKQIYMGVEQYEIFTHNGKVNTKLELVNFIRKITDLGFGEILINSIDADGTMMGYDFELVDIVRNVTDVPITVLGGASSMDDIARLVSHYKIIGAAAGSIFVFKGKYRAVLINYPSKEDKSSICKNEIV